MAHALSDHRKKARQLSAWLVERNRTDEALGLLCAWAVAGPNDPEGQELLAEALRLSPTSPLAQSAFERMEGVSGSHQELDSVVDQFGPEALKALDTEMRRPSFRRAQMGFNNNVRWQGQVFHVQTEDSGLDSPHIVTHLFADGGRIIKSHKREYGDFLNEPQVEKRVRNLMKEQHLEMVLMLKDGKFDPILAGEAVGGLELLVEAPSVDLQKLARRGKKERPESAPKVLVQQAEPKSKTEPPEGGGAATEEAAVTEPPPESEARARVLFTVLRSVGEGPGNYVPKGDDVVLGADGQVGLVGDPFRAPRIAIVRWREGSVTIEDIEGTNGAFLRIRGRVEIEAGDEFFVGDQMLRVERNPHTDDHPDPDPTYFYSSPKWPSAFRVTQVLEGGGLGASAVSKGNSLQIGAGMGDFVIGGDPLLADQHCVLEDQAGSLILTDLGSRTGVFVRIRGEQELVRGDELLIGRTRLVIEF